MASFTALITPFDLGLKPDNTLPGPQPTPPTGQPPVVDNTLPGDIPRPEHPIYFPLPPGAPVDPDYGIPETPPPVVDNTLPGQQPRPDNTLPGPQPRPEHPIVLPPGGSGGWLPVYIDNTLPGAGSAGGEKPTHPIVLPPAGSVPEGPVDWRAAWTPATGWIVVGFPTGPTPTPSKRKR